MVSRWTRSADKVPYPIVWYEFIERESKSNNHLVKYWIQDLPEERFDDAIQHLIDYFLQDAPRSKFFGDFFLIIQHSLIEIGC